MANVNLTGSIIVKYECSKNSHQNVEVARLEKKASSNNAVNKRYRFKDTNSLKVKDGKRHALHTVTVRELG